MKEPYPRIFPIWFLPVLVLIGFSMMQCGCRTGGAWLGKGSAGTVIVPQAPQEINENNRRETAPFDPQPLAPIPIIPKSNPVPITPMYNGPTPEILKKSIAPKSSIKEAKAEPKPLSKAPSNLIAGDGGCVVIVPEDVDSSGNEAIINKEDMKINWFDLLMFYSICLLMFVTAGMVYDVVRGYFKNRKELDKQKRPAKIKGVKSKKSPIGKKKATKKK